jgi:hypothetical protein
MNKNNAYKPKTAAPYKIAYLYHYQSCGIKRLRNFCLAKEIYLSCPDHFNDPWDCKPFYTLEGLDDPKKYEDYVDFFYANGRKKFPELPETEHMDRRNRMLSDRPLLEEMIKEFSTEYTADAAQKLGVYCLSANPTSTLMWSHYANDHRGICLQFRTDNELFSNATAVEYAKSFPCYDISPGDLLDELLPFQCKAIEWDYEEEYRLILEEGSKDPLNHMINRRRKIPNGSLETIILGALIAHKNEKKIRHLASRHLPSVKIRKARIVQGQYKIQIGD